MSHPEKKNLHMPEDSLEETAVTPGIIRNDKIIFIHTHAMVRVPRTTIAKAGMSVLS